MSSVATILAVSVMLGVSHTTSFSHLLNTTIDNVLWMIFYLRAYLGINIHFARFFVFLTILGACLLFYFFIASLLFLTCVPEPKTKK